MQYAINYILYIQYRLSSFFVLSLHWNEWTQFNPNYNWNYGLPTFCALLHSLFQRPGLHNQILNNRITQPANFQKAPEYIQLIQQVSTLTVVQVDDTRCLVPTCVQLIIKLKQDATSELGRQSHNKSLFIYEVHTITVHDITNNKHQHCFTNHGKHDNSSHTTIILHNKQHGKFTFKMAVNLSLCMLWKHMGKQT